MQHALLGHTEVRLAAWMQNGQERTRWLSQARCKPWMPGADDWSLTSLLSLSKT